MFTLAIAARRKILYRWWPFEDPGSLLKPTVCPIHIGQKRATPCSLLKSPALRHVPRENDCHRVQKDHKTLLLYDVHLRSPSSQLRRLLCLHICISLSLSSKSLKQVATAPWKVYSLGILDLEQGNEKGPGKSIPLIFWASSKAM